MTWRCMRGLEVKPCLPYNCKSSLHPFHGFRGLKNLMQVKITIKSWTYYKKNTVYSSLVNITSSISGNCPFLGPVIFLCDILHSLIIVLCFCHGQSLLSSTPKIAAALQFHFSSAKRITSHFNFLIYENLLDFWRPSSITMIHNKLDQTPVV
jgi:hypothetical protein